ncbi:hypothetical protein KNE206_78190 [Kitasatospora sp. NE20-6]|uniref:hypothetical protein n=1 Tax=Kitasatospora sp. NE20-6 TaxID=2859066 RepID=UPI0034DBF587
MKPREDAPAPTAGAVRGRFSKLPERIRPESTFVSVPTAAAAPERDGFSHDEWLARNVWCGSLI